MTQKFEKFMTKMIISYLSTKELQWRSPWWSVPLCINLKNSDWSKHGAEAHAYLAPSREVEECGGSCSRSSIVSQCVMPMGSLPPPPANGTSTERRSLHFAATEQCCLPTLRASSHTGRNLTFIISINYYYFTHFWDYNVITSFTPFLPLNPSVYFHPK